ncbi:MAG TPA: hypothetical protein VMW44_01205 [Candidatus Bathyarchaeia archaeon]|nr:hypothetical protein [Candidatus Bathyarchaeia archaeon]
MNNSDNLEKPEWIINNSGEIGVKLGDRCFFLSKGKSKEYADGYYGGGMLVVLYRVIRASEYIYANTFDVEQYGSAEWKCLPSLKGNK